jgi:tetratricopeptide (TPR) repeat protein
MRWLLPLLFVHLAVAARAEIRSVDACAAAIAADPARAREEAAAWERMGGGTAASLCEADALAATGAHATAAALLTNLAQDPNRAIPADARAVILADAATQWLAAEKPGLASETLAAADRLAPPDSRRLLLSARAAAALGEWPAARTTLETIVAREPGNALARALLAAALRHQGDPEAALGEARSALALAPDLPEAQFETAAALAETGDARGAAELWLRLIREHPDDLLAGAARVNLRRIE